MQTQAEKISAAKEMLKACSICPRGCGVDRAAGERGYCGMTADVVVSSISPHFGEEPPLVGHNGSGTIFLCGCSLRCAFCQNYDISHHANGRQVGTEGLVHAMLRLQQIGCHNINFVTPTHYAPQVMEAVHAAQREGLGVPVVYNCGGYESVETLRLLEGFVEIYMPDFKFASSDMAQRYCTAPDYPEVAKAALKEMQRQVGDLEIGDDGIATRGLLIRHLVMPGGLEDSKRVVDFIADEISPNAYVNVMEQYRPCGEAYRHPEINRPLEPDEFRRAFDHAAARGLRLA
ncbi:MAG: radical SAM protein [Planctomycetota bacterium]|nr:MAG: radical SAM protein [Planctomycetota bacterium]